MSNLPRTPPAWVATRKGRVEVQANLARKVDGKTHLLNRVYFHADRIETVREAMYAAKFFDGTDGTFQAGLLSCLRPNHPGREVAWP